MSHENSSSTRASRTGRVLAVSGTLLSLFVMLLAFASSNDYAFIAALTLGPFAIAAALTRAAWPRSTTAWRSLSTAALALATLSFGELLFRVYIPTH